MKAITYDKAGDPGVLTFTEQPDPTPGPAEVLVRVRATSVNPVDWKLMSIAPKGALPVEFPVIPGWDVAGVVEAVGVDAGEFAVGDEIVAYARKDWVHAGTYAELVTVPVRTAARKPASLSWEQAGGLPLAGLTAYQTLARLGLRGAAGKSVLIHAAAGGVGLFAVQIAKAWGLRVIGTASEANHDLLRELGAEPVAYGEGLVERVRALAPEGVDAVADFVGGVREETLAVLTDGGVHASIADGSVAEKGGLYVWVRPDAADLAALGEMADAGQLTVHIASTYPLERAADAQRESMAGHARGKIVLTV